MSDYDLGLLVQQMKHHVASGITQDYALAEMILEASRRRKKATYAGDAANDLIHQASTD